MGRGVGGEGSRAMRRRLGHALIRRAARATFSPREKEERALNLKAIRTSPILPAPYGHIFCV
jgi:hypothetical protein